MNTMNTMKGSRRDSLVESDEKKKYWRELTVFSLLLLLAFILSLLQTMGVKIPSPMKGIQYLIKDILGLSYE